MTEPRLDPGIRKLVALLQRFGFNTTDSGDGVSKKAAIAKGLAEPVPHVYMTASPDEFVLEARRLAVVLGAYVRADFFDGEHIDESWGQAVPNVVIDAIYKPRENIAILSVHGVADKHLVDE